MWNKVYDKYLLGNDIYHYFETIFDGKNVQIEKITSHIDTTDELIRIRISFFKDNHWQGDCEIQPQIRSLTFEKKYNKINKEKDFEWFLIKKYEDFNLYINRNEKYIMICNEIDEEVVYTSVYNIEEITE